MSSDLRATDPPGAALSIAAIGNAILGAFTVLSFLWLLVIAAKDFRELPSADEFALLSACVGALGIGVFLSVIYVRAAFSGQPPRRWVWGLSCAYNVAAFVGWMVLLDGLYMMGSVVLGWCGFMVFLSVQQFLAYRHAAMRPA